MGHDHPITILLGHRPIRPSHKAMNRVVLPWFAEWKLVVLVTMAIGATAKAVRPGQHALAPGASAALADPVAVKEGPCACGVGAQRTANLDHGCYLVAVHDSIWMPEPPGCSPQSWKVSARVLETQAREAGCPGLHQDAHRGAARAP